MRLIDADALKDKINKIYKDLETLDKGIFYPAHYELGAIRSIIYHIDKQPTIEPKQGEWKMIMSRGVYFPMCSNCGAIIDNVSSFEMWTDEENNVHWEYNFCPNCGARMQTERSE